ncbi:MAG TPA: hypothetical protein PK929_07340, partial [Quisquiliibacterium sp.]|nr:hypothetical protein [Quisquiliibacterium sp.]
PAHPRRRQVARGIEPHQLLIDDAGRALAEPQLERIGLQVRQRHQGLEEAGFPAGSPLALRLFN